jgi:RNA polymerase sigma-70 factor (ECF subfamily)
MVGVARNAAALYVSRERNRALTMDEAQLVQRAQQGDLQAFSELVTAYQGNIRACLAVRLNNRHEAEDLAQETFVRAFRKIKEFDPELALGPWLRGIAFNLLRNYFRKKTPVSFGGLSELEMMVDQHIALNHSEADEQHLLAAMRHCIDSLPGHLARLFKWRYHDEMSIEQLKKRLKLNHSTLTMRLHRLRTGLRQCIASRTAEGLHEQ